MSAYRIVQELFLVLVSVGSPGRWRGVARAALGAAFVAMAAAAPGPAGAQSGMLSQVVALDGSARTVAPPSGFLDACKRYAWLCSQSGSAGVTDPELQLSVAKSLNLRVNLSVTQVSDPENYGVAEYWTLPRLARGDCEDFVLEKYRRLIEAGIDSHDLAVAIVLNRRGDNHAVLVVHHRSGDFVLDNLSTRVLRWDETGYRFLAMQGRDDKRSWVVLQQAAPSAGGLLALR